MSNDYSRSRHLEGKEREYRFHNNGVRWDMGGKIE